MKKLFWFAVILTGFGLLFAGYMAIGLGTLAFYVIFYRLPATDKLVSAHAEVQNELLVLLISDLPAEEKHKRGWEYINQVNEEREKRRKDIFWKMSNFGLAETDPRFIK